MSNYAIKSDLKNVARNKLASKSDLVNLKTQVDKLDIDKLKNISTNLSNLISKADELDIDKLAPVTVN